MFKSAPSSAARSWAAMTMLAASASAWSVFIARFGWSGVWLGWWPAALIGGGGALAVLQSAQMIWERARIGREAGVHSRGLPGSNI